MADTNRAVFDKVAEDFARKVDDATVALKSAVYKSEDETIALTFEDGSVFSFPARSLSDLKDAPKSHLEHLELIGGDVLYFPALDSHHEVSSILAQRVGYNLLMAHLASRAGRTSTPAKAAAARSNGQKGGRPRKTKAA